MPNKKQPLTPAEAPPGKNPEPEVKPVNDPEEPLNVSEEDPDYIPGEDPFENLPNEIPAPGEGP